MYCFKHYIKTFNTKVLVGSKIYNPYLKYNTCSPKLEIKKKRKVKIIRPSLVDTHNLRKGTASWFSSP